MHSSNINNKKYYIINSLFSSVLLSHHRSQQYVCQLHTVYLSEMASVREKKVELDFVFC